MSCSTATTNTTTTNTSIYIRTLKCTHAYIRTGFWPNTNKNMAHKVNDIIGAVKHNNKNDNEKYVHDDYGDDDNDDYNKSNDSQSVSHRTWNNDPSIALGPRCFSVCALLFAMPLIIIVVIMMIMMLMAMTLVLLFGVYLLSARCAYFVLFYVSFLHKNSHIFVALQLTSKKS